MDELPRILDAVELHPGDVVLHRVGVRCFLAHHYAHHRFRAIIAVLDLDVRDVLLFAFLTGTLQQFTKTHSTLLLPNSAHSVPSLCSVGKHSIRVNNVTKPGFPGPSGVSRLCSMVIDIGTRTEPLVDDLLIDRTDGARRSLHAPERREIVFEADAPWESETVSFSSVIQEGERVRLYYRAATDKNKDEDHQSIGLAESYDGGLTFTRPSLGLVETEGSRDNNLVARGEQPLVPPVFVDTNPDCKPDQPYKGLTAKWKKLYAMCSEDGLHWRLMQEEPLEMSGTFDTVNTAFWDSRAGCYRSFTRYFENLPEDDKETDVLGAEARVVRAIQSSTSDDFLTWTPPVPHHYADDSSTTQLYTNATIPCPGAEHIYLAFPNRYVQHRVPKPEHEYPGINDALFMSSRDCIHWNRHLDAWVRPGLDKLNWTDRNNYPTWGIVRTSPSEWSMYISEHYRHPGIPVRHRRLSIRPHGFVSMHAGHAGGEVVTKPLRVGGKSLRINCSTSAAGSIRVAVLNEDGSAIPGFSEDDMDAYYGDELDASIEWNRNDLTSLMKEPIRLRFRLRDADLFSIRAAP